MEKQELLIIDIDMAENKRQHCMKDFKRTHPNAKIVLGDADSNGIWIGAASEEGKLLQKCGMPTKTHSSGVILVLTLNDEQKEKLLQRYNELKKLKKELAA